MRGTDLDQTEGVSEGEEGWLSFQWNLLELVDEVLVLVIVPPYPPDRLLPPKPNPAPELELEHPEAKITFTSH